MHLGPGGIQVLLPPLGGAPAGRHSVLIELFLVALAEMLFRCRNQGGVDDLPAPSHIAMPQELLFDGIVV